MDNNNIHWSTNHSLRSQRHSIKASKASLTLDTTLAPARPQKHEFPSAYGSPHAKMGQVYFVILRLPGEGVQLYHTNRHVMNLLDIVIRTIESINHEMAFGEARSKGFLQGLEMKRGCTNKSSQEQKTRLEQMPMESQLLKRHLGQREEILAR